MKRIILWIDYKEDQHYSTIKKVEAFLKSLKLSYTFVEICELVESEK